MERNPVQTEWKQQTLDSEFQHAVQLYDPAALNYSTHYEIARTVQLTVVLA